MEPVPRAQTFSVQYKKDGTDDWIDNPEDMYTDNEGVPEVPCILEGLEEDTNYMVKLTNLNGGGEFELPIHTAKNLLLGESPLYMKKVYAGQTLDIYENGLLDSSLPPNYDSFYYILETNYRDAYEGFSNVIPVGGMKWASVTDKDAPARKARGADLTDGRYIRLNDSAKPESRVNSEVIFGDGTRSFSMFVWFYMTDNKSATVLSNTTDTGQFFSVTVNGLDVYIGSSTASCRSNEPIEPKKWYCLELVHDSVDPNNTKATLHASNKEIGFSGTFGIPVGDESPVFIGASKRISDGQILTSEALIVRRLYYAKVREFPNSARYRLINPEDYLPKLIFEYTDGTRFTTAQSWGLKLDNAVMSTAIDPETPKGKCKMYIETPSGRRFEKDIELLHFDKRRTPIDVDFGANFDKALADFKREFYGFSSQWGGANGGTASDLVYAHRGEGALVFEQHGDEYEGKVQGCAKPYKNNQNTGYGAPLFHTIPDDPNYTKPWVKRVGSVCVSADYCGYGEWATWMKVPVGTYGVAPALWFFHYQEIYETDERWQMWIDKGGKPYGGSDPYMVINNEIDMELPSHLTNGTFAEWGEVALAYFDPLAMDDQYRIGVESEGDPDNGGLFRLTDPTKPNLRASWVKEADDYANVSHPSFSNCKFNNWVGEKSSGNGWAYDKDSYDGEEYLALMTKLDKTFADGAYHKWAIRWYKDRTELWIDDEFIRANRAFVPYIAGRLTFGGWYPSAITATNTKPWEYSPERAWAGYPANHAYLHLHIKRITFTPYDEAEAGGDTEYYAETYPETGLREFI